MKSVALLVGTYALSGALGVAQTGVSADLQFEVVAVRENTGSDLAITSTEQPPDGYRQTNYPLRYYVTYAFDVPQAPRMANMPEWALSVRYDVVAKAGRVISDEERRAMVRTLLRSRFGLKTHQESRRQNVYVLTVARPERGLGAGITPRPECVTQTCSTGGTGRPDGVEVHAVTMTRFASLLSNLMRQMVVDETGTAGPHDIVASWRPDIGPTDPSDSRPSMFTALEEQLGLKLRAEPRPVDVLVIDHIERAVPD